MDSVTEELNFSLHFILINLNLKNHTWLVVVILGNLSLGAIFIIFAKSLIAKRNHETAFPNVISVLQVAHR